MSRAARIVISVCLVFGFSLSRGQDQSIRVGERATVHSTVLNEERPLLIYTPDGYSGGTLRYPVVYLLDGNSHFLPVAGIVQFLAGLGLAPQMIVVAIPNTDRTRDLTMPDRADTTHQFPTAGGADRFLSFLTDELAPYIDAHYRTEPFRILIGHSLGGLFAVHTLFRNPDAFHAYIAMSPSLWWDNRSELDAARTFFLSHREIRKFLYMTLGSEGTQMQEAAAGLAGILKESAPAGVLWKYLRIPEETHGTIPLRSAYEGLKFVFTGFVYAGSNADSGISKLVQHYADLSEKLGYTVDPPEVTVNSFGYVLLQEKKVQDALAMFRFNVRMYPGSANVYDSFADGLEANNEPALALENCETACRVGEKNADPNLRLYRAHRDRLAERGEKK
jgi:predicted alpha/beta superfamily hydrolase